MLFSNVQIKEWRAHTCNALLVTRIETSREPAEIAEIAHPTFVLCIAMHLAMITLVDSQNNPPLPLPHLGSSSYRCQAPLPVSPESMC